MPEAIPYSQSGNTAVSVTKRLQNELMQLMMAGCTGISAFPENDNLYSWLATITGPTDTPYAGLTYRLSLRFPENYPFVPPKVKFETPIYHPNVDAQGNICLDILKDKWSAVYSVQTVLLSIQSLLEEPNNNSPLNAQAAEMWSRKEDYRQVVLSRTPGLSSK